jgi:hypothetical protein
MPDHAFEEFMERLWMPIDGEIDALKERADRMERRARWGKRRTELKAWLARRPDKR